MKTLQTLRRRNPLPEPVRSGWMVCPGGVLELGTQPADETSFFFMGSFVTESDQTFEEFFVGQIVRPAVGVKHRRVEFLLDLLQHTDEPFFVDLAFFGRDNVAVSLALIEGTMNLSLEQMREILNALCDWPAPRSIELPPR